MSESTLYNQLSTEQESGFQTINENTDDNESNFEVTKSTNYSSKMKHLINSIIKYNEESKTISDYPYFIEKNRSRYVPSLSKRSEIITPYQLVELNNNLPYYQQYKNLILLYSMNVDGTSIKTFYDKCKDKGSTILLIKDDENNVFGAYANEEYKYNPNNFYGTGETFLFTFYNTNTIHCFLPTGENDNYIYSDYERLAFGCSDDYFSLCLENDFWKGYSKTTKTFKNSPLTEKENFNALKLELWGFADDNKY